MSQGKAENGPDRSHNAEAVILDITRRLAAELRARPTAAREITLDSLLDRELGFDSLGRVELLARIEHAFNVSLTERALAAVETPRDLLRATQAARPGHPPLAPAPPPPPPGTTETPPAEVNTLLAVLDWHVRAHPARPHIYLIAETGEEEEISYAMLQRRADAVAAGLRKRDLLPGQTVAIMLPTGLEYFFAFYGVLRAGGIPVPIYPPARLSQIEEHLRRHARILANARAAMLITVAEAKPFARLLRLQVEGLRTVVTPAELLEAAAPAGQTAVQAQDIALLQYTSGSTGNPKGAILTHANLLANIRAMGEAIGANSSDVFVSWMPLYHDMGLIGAWLGSLYYAVPLAVMSPLTFLTRPERWLWAIHRHRATLSGAPNFGYELCLRRVQDRDLEGLDLSSWRTAFNGAEPVSPDTIARFHERFSRYGFRRETMYPVFGLAESSVGLAFPPLGRAPIIDCIQRESLMREGRAVPTSADDATALRFVACGQPLPGHQIRLIDSTGYEVSEREEGRLEFQGPSATSGYFRNPEETRRLFHDGWLDSGDLAYMAGGDVYITGRVKDVIIRAGRNIYPHELEEAIGNLPGMRKGCIAVFGSIDRATATEKLVVLAETRETEPDARERLQTAITALAVDLAGAAPDDVVLVSPHTVLKTSSGKVRRAASRELYERGRLTAPTRPAWQQILRLAWTGVTPQLRRAARAGGALLYALHAWTLFWILAPLVWLAVAALPRPAWSLAVIRAAAKLLRRLSGVSLHVHGLDKLPRGPCVIAANHASYLDGIILTAVLPGVFSFVAKREFTERLVARVFLQNIGTEFVERFELARGVEDARVVAHAARRGRTLVFFPEGTFTRTPGLLPFHMGAFVAAAEAGVPIVPVAIRGTRSILRSDHWFPRRGTISVVIGAPIQPEGSDWATAIKLRDAARLEILRHCGEPDLA
ncbi:MAG: acyl-phosphate glycerol 3-phosphate acyltransferase [Candidatus Muproteobacteria bacterium RIFCSPHIGHO2_12_FULL_60_33]|nr:MAG: acyl-phosphate glycerol 3-phosphate acyltransferase [Candidatus Muproteobacteria bacterium RIFCSPHIGHO2_12_FULL_60_33]OGI57726.1 MAG: acyl-phosphate glycerol 3-phosphate acyltransferase [Candidatus Muproteobacteria bacterium RIFCSPHIGHO2_01_FULL_61_200]